MLAAGKASQSLVVSHLQSNARVGSSLMIGSVRTLFVPSDSGSRKKMYKHFSATAAVGKRIRGEPSLDICRAMPLSPQELDNSSLVTLGEMGNSEASREILTRHVVSTDNVSYDAACEKVEEIAEKNREGMFLLSLPYNIGITVAVTAGLASVPLVFHLPTAEWFNMHYVTTDVPEPKDLETALEVGAWTWNWMEPPLGQISFFLLCLQFSRAQIQNLGLKPYTSKVKEWRAKRLVKAYPQYDETVIMKYSTSSNIYNKHCP